MRAINWNDHRLHRTQVIKDTGQWIGLIDENGYPICDLPPLTAMTWPENRGTPADVTTETLIRTPSGNLHTIANELIAENLTKVDETGALIPAAGPSRFIALEREAMTRRAMRISHVVAEGDRLLPYSMTMHGVDLLGILDMLPCPSNPATWLGEFTRFDRDWVGDPEAAALFEHERDLASITMIAVADGASVEGRADEVIFRLIDESLTAIHRVAGISSDPPYVAILGPQLLNSPRLILRPTDQTIWQEIGEAALAAGVSIRAGMWWPGDPQPAGKTLTQPTITFEVTQEASWSN